MPQPFSWWDIVSRSTVVQDGHKLAWDAIRRRDNPKTGDGCYESTEQIAGRIGKSPRTTEGLLQDLRRLGLLVIERRGNRYHRWVRLPESCYPSERPTDGELAAFGRRLDAMLAPAATSAPVPLDDRGLRR